MQDKMYEMTLLNVQPKCPRLSGTWSSESAVVWGKWASL